MGYTQKSSLYIIVIQHKRHSHNQIDHQPSPILYLPSCFRGRTSGTRKPCKRRHNPTSDT